MTQPMNGRVGIFNHKNCIGRDFACPRVLVITMYIELDDYYETMVLTSSKESKSFNKITVHYYYSREEAVEGHIGELARQAYLH